MIGRDDIIPDEVKQEGDFTVYKLTWFTNGYARNRKGQRHQLRFSFVFESFELARDFQVMDGLLVINIWSGGADPHLLHCRYL